MISVTQELKRLLEGINPTEEPAGVGLVSFVADCAGQAEAVLERVKEVLGVVLTRTEDQWPTGTEWERLLPAWFVVACAPERNEEEEERWLLWWKSLPPNEQARVEGSEPWALSDWIHWFNPEMRSWYWWKASANDPDVLRVEVEVASWPFASGALEWLLRAAGAVHVEKKG